MGVERTALAFDRACSRTGVGYAFVGGIAVLAWGQPRATSDVDALVILSSAEIPEFSAALHAEGLKTDPRDFADALDDGSHVTAFDEETGFHVDCRIARTDMERAEIAHARSIPYEGGRLVVVAPEETIAFKLKFGSPQDIQDARSILVRQQGRLDVPHLQGLARRLGVEKALDALLDDVSS